MASFAINLDLILKYPNASFSTSRKHELEGSLLKSLSIKLDDFEPKANNCTEFYVWHTKTLILDKDKLKKKQKFEKNVLI